MTVLRKRDWVWDHAKFNLSKFIITHFPVQILEITFASGIVWLHFDQKEPESDYPSLIYHSKKTLYLKPVPETGFFRQSV
jgi:hypothetical protein